MIELKVKPMTHNGAYSTNRMGRRFLKKEGVFYKGLVSRASMTYLSHLKGIHKPLLFRYEVFGPWLTKKGEISKTASDLDGIAKLLLDAICEPLGINDSCVYEIRCRKVQADDWKIAFTLEPIYRD